MMLFIEAVVWPLGCHKYEYVPVPPEALTCALPVAEVQIEVVDEVLAVSKGGFVSVTLWLTVHPKLSRTATLYVPGVSPEMLLVVCDPGFHKYVKLPVPPEAITDALPSFPLLQFTTVEEIFALIKGA